MITELSIRNFAIIEALSISFDKGLTVLSGETGAGKSIIIDAIHLLYEQKLEQVDKWTEQLQRGSKKLFDLKAEEWISLQKRLKRSHPNERIDR